MPESRAAVFVTAVLIYLKTEDIMNSNVGGPHERRQSKIPMIRIKNFFKKETVFCISFLLAVISCVAVLPDAAYLAYPDYRTLALLFCLMTIVSGFQSLGVFTILGQALLKRVGSLRGLSSALVFLCFFCSMVITNDVALITFVPFTILVFRMIQRQERVLKVVVLETIAANLGSMATPIGNPQNLYLYSISGLTAAQFGRCVLPYAGLSLVMLLGILLSERGEAIGKTGMEKEEKRKDSRWFLSLISFLLLLILCMLVVLRILPYGPVLVCVALAVLVVNRKVFLSVDYFLLLTFLCFFIFIGNIKRIPWINSLLISLVDGQELWAGILASQVISNVPAAILLSGFTENYETLITAVNLGGLGTLIASLASLISFKFFVREYPDKKGVFLKTFTVWNLLFLAVLTGAALFLA